MKGIIRYYLINMISLWVTTELIRGVSYTGGFKTLALGALAFTAINFILVPLIKILLLPLNILTLGLFAWVTNVLALYTLINLVPDFHLTSYYYPGFEYQGFIVPPADFSTFWVAILASFLIGLITHFMHWLIH